MYENKANKRATKVLVVDAGNTRLKWTAFDGDTVIGKVYDSEPHSFEDFYPEVIYFASVRSNEQNAMLHADIQAAYPDVEWLPIVATSQARNVKNSYEEPQRLGVDRWLSSIAAYHEAGTACLIIDAGTAIKADFVSAEGVHLGGYIVPGLKIMKDVLVKNTARIRYDKSEVSDERQIPNNTAGAVELGCKEMAIGFVERLIRQHSDYTWFATGGEGEALIVAAGAKCICDEHLVAKGAKLVGDELIENRKT
ncbi:type III pantothenate kinase [Marinomonas balearica]|uniref:Type III pantothenate kinase n=1 Tax=Marinomonas balearica TaxID=491947 RepID=A0A4R6M756_9GAMM|nr:type III pantothenate kinase [Marinomonas balearica]TDO97248.1 type III pantothenate kinase [Marinomonas balearica]